MYGGFAFSDKSTSYKLRTIRCKSNKRPGMGHGFYNLVLRAGALTFVECNPLFNLN